MGKLKNDLILVCTLLIIAVIGIILIFTLSKNNNLEAKVYYKDDIILTIDMDKDGEYKVKGEISEVTFKVSKGSIRIIKSDCHDHICINQGSISNSSQSITCLPNKIYVKLISKKKEGVDVTI